MTEQTPLIASKSGLSILPSWQKVSEFVVHVFQLERSVGTLRDQDKRLEEEVSRLQLQVAEQAGQLKAVMELINTTVAQRAAAQAEQAAARMFTQLLALRDEPPPVSDD